jgi:hypothetical protein
MKYADKENLRGIVLSMTDPQLKFALMCVVEGADVDYAILVSVGKEVKKNYLEEAIKNFEFDLRERPLRN